MKGFSDSANAVEAITQEVRTTSVNGSSVERGAYHGLAFIATVVAYTDGDHVVSLEHSDDGSTWTAVASTLTNNVPATIDAAGFVGCHVFDYLGDKSFVRPVITSSGTTTGANIGVHAVRNAGRYAGANSLAD